MQRAEGARGSKKRYRGQKTDYRIEGRAEGGGGQGVKKKIQGSNNRLQGSETR